LFGSYENNIYLYTIKQIEIMTNSKTIETLNKKFNSLNKKYLRTEKNTVIVTDFDQIDLSEKLENIQIEMSKISTKLEELEN